MKHRPFTPLSVCWMFLLVFLFQNPLQATMLCNNPLESSPGQLSPTNFCIATIDGNLTVDDGSTCDGPFAFVVRDEGGVIIATDTNTVNVDLSNYLNTVISIETTDLDENLSCTSYYLVEDKQPPTITCPDDEVVCTAPTTPADINAITVVDNCDVGVTAAYVDNPMGPSCTFPVPHIGKIVRVWSATDDSGNTSVDCLQEILILRPEAGDIEFPEDITLDCSQAPAISLTGRPTIGGNPILPNGFCNIAVGSSDVVSSIGDCQDMQISRTWSLVISCTGELVTHTQNIWIEDMMPPVMTCPDTLFFDTDTTVCVADFDLPLPTTVDDCNTFEVTASITGYGTGFSYDNVPPGVHTLTYEATDACGNFSTCETVVVVEDDETPTAVCDGTTVVSLPSNGVVVLAASTFDEGSNDNCSPLTFLVSKENGPFEPTIEFNCDDIAASPIMVTLLVQETLDPTSQNTCMTLVTVDDKLGPALLCPPDLTISCQEWFDDLIDFGTATVYDGCGYDLEIEEDEDVSNCGVGTIARTFTATDPSGNSSTCTQMITVANSNPFDGSGIVFPEDYTTTGNCVVTSELDPENLPSGFDYPVLPTADCAMLATSYDDQLFYFDYPACYKIVRTWQVMDWCQFSTSNPTVGIWSAQQVIVVMDTVPPNIMFCPQPDTFGLTANCDPATVTIAPVIAEGTCPDEDITITNDSPYSTDSGADASGVYPEGEHVITYTVTDGCGNTATCSTTIVVADLKEPTPYCKSGLIGELQAMPNVPIMVILTAEHLNDSSFDNCTDAADLVFTIRELGDTGDPVDTLIFDCADQGEHEIELWVTDEAGNSDYCITNFIVQDNMELCNDDDLVAGVIGGDVQTTMGDELPDVHVEISAMAMEAMTDDLGDYTFEDLSVGNTYLVEPWKNDDPTNGITTFDLVLMSKHVLQISPLTDPYKLIAADINNSGAVTTADIVELKKLVLQIYDEFPDNDSWRFVRADYEFPDTLDPWTPAFPEFVNIPNHDEDDVLDANFVAVKIGDLNGSAAANLNTVDDRNRESFTLLVEDREVRAGEELSVPVKFEDENDLLALQFTLEFETDLELQGIEKGELSGVAGDRFETTRLQAGIVTGTWYHTEPVVVKPDAALFSLRFKSQRAGRLSEMLNLTSSRTEALAYTGEGMEQDLNLYFKNNTDMGSSITFQLHQNQPNPFKKFTQIGFTLPEASPAKLTIYDLSGSILGTWEQHGEQGFNQITIRRSELPTSGVLYYQLETPSNTATKKMILLN